MPALAFETLFTASRGVVLASGERASKTCLNWPGISIVIKRATDPPKKIRELFF